MPVLQALARFRKYAERSFKRRSLQARRGKVKKEITHRQQQTTEEQRNKGSTYNKPDYEDTARLAKLQNTANINRTTACLISTGKTQ